MVNAVRRFKLHSIGDNMVNAVRRMLLGAVLAGVAASAAAQDYPARPISLVVPYPPGGAVDVFGRLIGQKLGQTKKWNIVIENRPGAAGNIGIAQAARQPADGYTMIMGLSSNLAIGPHIYKNLGYDPLRDLTPVLTLAKSPMVLLTGAQSRLKSFDDLKALAHDPANNVTFATPGNGSVAHLTGEALQQAMSVHLTHVPYRGSVQAMNDVAGGRADLFMASIASASPFIAKGMLKPLAVTNATRVPDLPEVPTVAELGYPGFDAYAWWSLLAPAGTPLEVVQQWNGAVNDILKMPDVRHQFNQQGAEVLGDSPEQAREFMVQEYERWGKVVRESNISVQ